MIQRRIKEPVTLTLSFTVEAVSGTGPPIVSLHNTKNGHTPSSRPALDRRRLVRKYSEVPRSSSMLNIGTMRKISDAARSSTTDMSASVMATKRYLAPRHFSSAENVQVALQKIREKEQRAITDRANDVYSKSFVPKKYAKHSLEYGTPLPGSLTEMRAKKAAKHIAREMLHLCEVIEEHGRPSKRNGQIFIKFGELFHIYQFISDKVVGMLLRARKHQLVDFEGEMLYQRQDEEKVITLLVSHEHIQQALKEL